MDRHGYAVSALYDAEKNEIEFDALEYSTFNEALEAVEALEAEHGELDFERKHFELPGPAGCNMCAGILSSRVAQGLQDLELTISPSVIMGRVQRYVLHWRQTTVTIEQPDPTRRILSVFRGAGPKRGALPPEASFDTFLLSRAEVAGATLIPERVLEEIMAEGTMLISGVDVDIRFGESIEVEKFIVDPAIERDISSTRRIDFDDPIPSKRVMRKTVLKIMQSYMAAIYGLTTINHDHLCMRSIVIIEVFPFS